jgi:hypothetical protein
MASFMQKADKRQIRLAMDAMSRQVIAFHIGDRKPQKCKRL